MTLVKTNSAHWILLLIVFLLALPGYAQRNCGTVEFTKSHFSNPEIFNSQFENWIQKKLIEKSKPSITPFYQYLKKETLVQIPVVVHIIHNGEPIGDGANIPDEQILSQIEVLNEDFRRLNGDASQTLPNFAGVAADSEIEFVLAKQDPEGLPTDGIVRVQGSESLWFMSDDVELKATSYWPAEDYMNFWVANLGGGLLGYAQLPVSNLEGLEDSEDNRLTDGIVIGHQYFGSSQKFINASLEVPFNLGRTTTHEVGHFFGLRHIWGDCGCGCDDFVTDTPIQMNSTSGCPIIRNSCGSDDMFQNFMDYTDDACMNLFTEGQKERMHIVLENSPRRASLTSSVGLLDPINVDLDLGLKAIIAPVGSVCDSEIVPSALIRNYGSDTVLTADLEFYVDGLLEEQKTLSINLESRGELLIDFESISLPPTGTSIVEFRIISVNGQTDEISENNSLSEDFVIPVFTILPFRDSFESGIDFWTIENNDEAVTWELNKMPGHQIDNSGVSIAFRGYSSIGVTDKLISPQITLGTSQDISLNFDWSYQLNGGVNNDRLQVKISTDCGANFDQVVFDKKGSELSTTANNSFLTFWPSDRQDWLHASINLGSFGSDGVQIAFYAINGGGNNLFIDNISVASEDYIDAGIKGLSSSEFINCSQNETLSLTIENLGNAVINSVSLDYTINGQLTNDTFNNLSLLPGQVTDLSLDALGINSDLVDLSFTITADGDIEVLNNQFEAEIITACAEDIVPLREKFESSSLDNIPWVISNPDRDPVSWQLVNGAMRINNFNSNNHGLKDYLISPTIDLREQTEASMFFDLSYAYDDSKSADQLKILISTDGGMTFLDPILEIDGEDFAVSTSENEWIPSSGSDWVTEQITLSSFVGEQVLIAIESTGFGNNNIYLDNIEFYASGNLTPLTFSNELRIYPNPADGGQFNLTFNLENRQDIQVAIYDAIGNIVYQTIFENTLNQTYPFDLAGNMDGIYIIKTVGSELESVDRIFINP